MDLGGMHGQAGESSRTLPRLILTAGYLSRCGQESEKSLVAFSSGGI